MEDASRVDRPVDVEGAGEGGEPVAKRPRYDSEDGMEWLYSDEEFDVDDSERIKNVCYTPHLQSRRGEALERLLMDARQICAERDFMAEAFRALTPSAGHEPDPLLMRNAFQDLVARLFFRGTALGGSCLIHPDGSVLTSISCLPNPRDDLKRVYEVEFDALGIRYSVRATVLDDISFTAVLVPVDDQSQLFQGTQCFNRSASAVSDCDQILYAFQLGVDLSKEKKRVAELRTLCAESGIVVDARANVSTLLAALRETRVVKMVCYDDVGIEGSLALSLGFLNDSAKGCPVLDEWGNLVGIISSVCLVPDRARRARPIRTLFGNRHCEFQEVDDLKRAAVEPSLRNAIVRARTIVEFAREYHTKNPFIEWYKANPVEKFRKRRFKRRPGMEELKRKYAFLYTRKRHPELPRIAGTK